jgi:class 3 adenylate cyclase/tetratricopeptide (TPR) repeat protein
MKCPNCGFENLPEMKFCGMCGARLTQICSNCGFANPLVHHFCGMCGSPLITSAPSHEDTAPVTGDGAVRPYPADLNGGIAATPSLVRVPSPAGKPSPQAKSGAPASASQASNGQALPPEGEAFDEQRGAGPSAELRTGAAPSRRSGAALPPEGDAATRHSDALLGTSRASPPPLSLEGERRVATIVIADVKGSTDLIEQVGTERWVEIMNRVLQILETEVYRYGGEVDQFRGDGLVAFFGASAAHEDDPERAVLAAMSMQESLKAYAAELMATPTPIGGVSDPYPPIHLQLRVGVNTGEVIAASIGNRRQHREDTAMGGAIALAARMEAAAEPGTVLVSENTYRLVPMQFEWEPLGKIKVKGIRQPVSVYRPLAPRLDAERHQGYDLAVPLIGRDTEFHVLKGCVEDLLKGRGGIVMVTGDRGIGKSYLMYEVRHHFARQNAVVSKATEAACTLNEDRENVDGVAFPNPEEAGDDPSDGDDRINPEDNADVAEVATSTQNLTWIRGRCYSYGQSWPYTMWLSLLQNWLGVRPEEHKEEETRNRLKAECEDLWGDEMGEYYPYLATFLSLPLEKASSDRIKHLSAEGLRQRFFLTIRSWIEALVKHRGPLVLSLTDMHWANSTSLDLLKYCLPLCDQIPLLWVFVFRLEAHRLEDQQLAPSPVWEFRHYVETEYPHRLTNLPIPPLTKTQSGEFIDRLIGPGTLPEETRAFIIDKAEGNPYYIKELIHSLINQGVLVREGKSEGAGSAESQLACDGWRVTRAVTSLDLPESLQSLLTSRIDHLAPEERQVLQMAAVIGPVFWSNVLQALASHAASPIASRTLREHLTTLQRVQLIRERGQVSELGMEYVFKSSLIRDAAYEGLLSAQRSAYHLQVAEYLESHFDMETLAPYYGVLAYHYRQGGEPGKELFYTLQAAEQARKIYANAEALEHYTHALELLDEMEEQAQDEDRRYVVRTQRFEVLDGRREVHSLLGNFSDARRDAEALLPLARQLEDDAIWLIDALLQQPGVGWWRYRDEIIDGIPLAEEALGLARELGDRHREMRCLTAIAEQRANLNDPTWPAVADRALELARELGDRNAEVNILIGLGRIYAFSEPERSMDYLEAALPIVQALDDKQSELNLLELIGTQLESNDDYFRRLREHRKQLQLSREIGNRPAEAEALMFCGQVQGIYLGDYEGGLALLKEGRRIIAGLGGELYFLLRIAQIQTLQAKYEDALQTLEHARRLDSPLHDMGRIGLNLVSAILYNAIGDEAHLRMALDLANESRAITLETPQITQQYDMVAACEATAAHLGLAMGLTGQSDHHYQQALSDSQTAVDIYEEFGFMRPIECISEEIYYRHSLALAASGQTEASARCLEHAYEEIMRKHAMIPEDSDFRRTYLENIPIHQEILATYAASTMHLDEA